MLKLDKYHPNFWKLATTIQSPSQEEIVAKMKELVKDQMDETPLSDFHKTGYVTMMELLFLVMMNLGNSFENERVESWVLHPTPILNWIHEAFDIPKKRHVLKRTIEVFKKHFENKIGMRAKTDLFSYEIKNVTQRVEIGSSKSLHLKLNQLEEEIKRVEFIQQ